jgi:hypothetical protein
MRMDPGKIASVLTSIRAFIIAEERGKGIEKATGSSAWKKQADLRYRLSVYKRYLDNENIIISQSL